VRRVIYTVFAVLLLGVVTYGLSKLEPAAPAVERATVFIDEVKRGPMLRQVRGLGALVPEEILLIPASDEGRVERRLVLPGSPVEPDTVLLELSSPLLEQLVWDAESQLKATEADYANLKVQLESQRLDQESMAAQVEAEYSEAQARFEADQELAEEGLIPNLNLTISRANAEQLAKRLRLEHERVSIRDPAVEAQLAAQQARIDQARGLMELRRGQFDKLKVRAGARGVLQQLEVEVGQLVTPGTPLARVSDPRRLKAELRIPETQAKDVQFGPLLSG